MSIHFLFTAVTITYIYCKSHINFNLLQEFLGLYN